MSRVNFKKIDHAKGFSLVETMVGMTLGLFTVVIIMQVFSVFENQKRTTTAGSDAQENGLMAIVQLEQAVRSAGAGITDSAACDCANIHSYYNGTVPAPGVPTTANAPLASVVITDGTAAGVADTITMLSGTNFLGSMIATLDDTMPLPSSELKVDHTMGFVDGQLILVTQDSNCTVMQVSQVQGAASNLQHNPGVGYPYNPAGNFYNTSPGDTWPHYTVGAKILPFGGFVVNTYSVDANRNLQMVDGSGAVTKLFKDIVGLKAQYGIAEPSGSQNVTSWVDATGNWASDALNSTKVKQIKAIRITVVARSGKKETANVTAIAPVGVGNLADWQKYRYRVYTTIIPLRNIIWANV